MNQLQRIALIACYLLPGLIQAEEVSTSPLILIDEIDCVICGPAYNKPLTDTDLTWKRIPFENDTKFIPLQKQIQTDIIMQQVASEKMPLDPSAIEKQIETIKKQLKINDAQLEEYFEQVGRTMAEGLEWVASQYTSEFFTHYKFKSQLVPTDDEIIAYYEDNPDFFDGWYEIKIARIPYEQDERDDIKNRIAKAIEDNTDADGLIFWGPSIKVGVDNLSEEQKFIVDMKPTDIRVHESPSMFELVKLIAHEPTRVKSLEECRSMIIDVLNRKKLESMLQAYNESVHDFVDIIPLKNIAKK